MKLFAPVACLSLVLLFLGCGPSGPQIVHVVGSITVGGKPAEGAILYFHPATDALSTASATAKPDGTFVVMYNSAEGIPVGKYKVTAIWPDPAKKPTQAQLMMGTAEVGPDLLKGKYATKAGTSLEVDITGQTKELPAFNL